MFGLGVDSLILIYVGAVRRDVKEVGLLSVHRGTLWVVRRDYSACFCD